jgi:hypothetical protein
MTLPVTFTRFCAETVREPARMRSIAIAVPSILENVELVLMFLMVSG